MESYCPYQHAEELGIRVVHRNIRTANGLWIPDHNLIVIKQGMRAVHDRSALAHEIAHALLGHRDDRPKHEVQADRMAACNLLDYKEVEAAMTWIPDCHLLAAEMGVSTRIMRCFLNLHRLAG
jgi:Zn-dependent peptidase ImmA (M78 family)